MKTRLAFFAALAVFLAIAVTPAAAPPKPKPLKIVKGPYLQQLTPESIVIMWETKTAADSWVDYWITPEEPYSVEGPTSVKIHEVLLDVLAADTVYQYTVTSGTVTSATSTFATAPDTERDFRFVAYGDTRTNKNDHAAVIQAIIASEPEFVLHTGDLVSDGDNKNVWGPEFFDPAYDLMVDTPLLPIIGNHEGSGNLFRDFFSLGDNDDWFAFSYSNVRFIGLNTHNRSFSPGSTQYNWLLEELTSDAYTNATWHIVYFHHPPYTATTSHSDEIGVQTHLVPLFEEYGVDMVFNGHSHAYERYFNNGIYYIVTGGGGAPLRDLVEDTKEPIREFGETTYHHCVIDVNVADESLTLSARYNNGQEFDTITLPPVDVTPPTASLIVPLDNGPDDLDADDGEVTVNTTQLVFDIQLSDVGDGIDVGTVISAAVTLTEQETGPVDYSFGYDAGLDVITLTSTGGDFGNGLYEITLSGIADMAGNPMAATTLSILIDTSIVPPETLSFQQGVDGYSAMVDTMIRWADPETNFATQFQSGYDYQYNADTESSGGLSQVLLRFDEIIGPDPGQIPAGSTIVSATLRIRSTDDGHGGKLHRILVPWVDTEVTWNNSFGGNGIQADGISEAASLEDDGAPLNSPGTDVDLDVTTTVQDWADGIAVNNGWAILPGGTNGWHMAAAEHPTLGYRPELIVTFLTTGNRPPVADAGADQTVSDADGTEAEIVTLDGSGSYDPDGTISTYEWTEGAAILGTSDIITYDFAVGTHTVTLTVTDNEEATDSDDVVITVNPADTTAPTIDSVWAPSETTVEVVFSEPVEKTSAEEVGNYAIDQGVTISSATLQADTETVVLTVSTLSEGITYTLTVNNVTDRASTPNPITSNTQETFEYVVEQTQTYMEDFESGYTLGEKIGTHDDWYDGGNGPTVTSGIGVAGSVGLTEATAVFNWTALPFNWNEVAKVIIGMDFQTDGSGHLDDDRCAWTINSGSVASSNLFGVQIDPGGGGDSGYNIEGYWDGGSAADKRPSIVDMPALSANAWYRLRVEITKLTATSASIYVELWSLDVSGTPDVLVASGAIEDTSELGDDAPHSKYFTSGLCPAYKNYTTAAAAADNAYFEIVPVEVGQPVADAGPDQTVTDTNDSGSESVTLDGSASYDPDGMIVSYEWDIDGDQITDYTGETVLDVPLGVGIHTVTLTVEDNEGATDTDDVVITVNPAPDTEPPTAPTDLTATAISTTQIDLDWAGNSESDLSHYNVKRSATMEGPYTEIASNVTVSNYSDTGLTASTTYYYVVTAVDTSSNESGNSNEASATTLQLSVPEQATEPTPSDGQTGVNRNTVILSWTAGAGATSHDVYLGTDPAALPLVSAGQSETTYDPPKLGRKTMYYWRIDEFNAAGTTAGVVWSFTTN